MTTPRTAKQIVRAAADNYSVELIRAAELDRYAVRYLRTGVLVDDGLADWQIVEDYDPNDDGWVREELRDPERCRSAARLTDEQVDALYCEYCRRVSNIVRAMVRARARKLRRWHTLTAKLSSAPNERAKALINRALVRVEWPVEGYDLPGPMPRHGVPGSI